MAEKLRYEFDPHHRLAVKGEGPIGVRKVLDGQFRISDHNTLTYHIKSPVPAGFKAPHQLKLKGTWSLTKDHQLRLTFDKWRRQTFGDQLTLQGEIIDAGKNSLLFAVTTRSKDGKTSLYALELSGLWQADAHNRLSFRVDKGRGRNDPLIFDGAWQINKNHEIVYSYGRESLAQERREKHVLAFKGHWDIRDKARLSYVLDREIGSGFDFETSAGVFKDKCIRYELGIRLKQKKSPVRRSVTFVGKWRVRENAGLVFEVERAGGKTSAFVFGAQARLKDRQTVLLNLRNDSGKRMGVQLELSREIFRGQGQAFLRLLGSGQESALLIGAGHRW